MSKHHIECGKQSELFSSRLEQSLVVPIMHRNDIRHVLRANGYEHKKNEYIATTYFSVNPTGEIWQWENSQDIQSVVRFKQRFASNPFKSDSSFELRGGGDLEVKIHDRRNPKNTKKKSIHIPEHIGIEKLIAFSNGNQEQFNIEIASLIDDQDPSNIDSSELSAHLNNGLRPLTTKTSTRDTFVPRYPSSRITIDSNNGFYAYPYLDVPILKSVKVAERNDITKVDVKYPPENQIGFDKLRQLIGQYANHETRAETGLTFTQMRGKALKIAGAIVQEEPEFEFESKLAVQLTDPNTDLVWLTQLFYELTSQGKIPGYQLPRYTPCFEIRMAEKALRKMYGWVDNKGKVHEVVTLIEVESDPKQYFLKRKKDPESTVGLDSMKREEKVSVVTEMPDMETLIQKESQTIGHSVVKIADYRKEKIAFKIEEAKTGRMFFVSIDKTNIEGREDLQPLFQMEMEYSETPSENISKISQSLEQSCENLRKALCDLQVNDITLTPTNQRKIEWLYQNSGLKN